MTPAERATARAIAAGHPSTWSGVSALPPPERDATPVAGGEVAAAAEPPAPPFDDFHATVTSINAAADRLRKLKDRR